MTRERWLTDLRKAGLNAPAERMETVTQVLMQNGLSSFRKLRWAGDPATWLSGNLLRAEEIAFLVGKANSEGGRAVDRSRSRGRAAPEVIDLDDQIEKVRSPTLCCEFL